MRKKRIKKNQVKKTLLEINGKQILLENLQTPFC